jgi:threonine dehydrogenase-like Zn-dependent dehydrogenase
LGAPEILWDTVFLRNIKITGGMAPVRRYLPQLLPLISAGRLDPSPVVTDISPVVTDILPLEEAVTGYNLMAKRQEGTIKVAVSP